MKKRAEFCAAVAEVDPDHLVYLDEMGVHVAMTPTQARALVGERAVCSVPGSHGGNISVIAAMRREALLEWYAHDGAVNEERCVAFGHRFAVHLKPSDVVIMDNVRFHHTAAVKAVIEATGARILYIPPYHPELDAIEEVFSVVKRDVRRREPRSVVALVDALRAAFGRLTRAMLRAFVDHALDHAIQPS